MSNKQLTNCDSGRDLLDYAARNPIASFRKGKGRHVMVTTPLGGVVVVDDCKDLHTGIKNKLIKVFISIGLGVLAIAYVIQVGIV